MDTHPGQVLLRASIDMELQMLRLRRARTDEADVLTGLCLRSKAVWGYDDSFMEACRAELTMTPRKIETSHVQVAELGGKLAGVARLCLLDKEAELAALFVEPAIQGLGVGRALFDWAAAECRAQMIDTMVIDADPGAASFYHRMGATEVGLVPSGSIPGRFIPRLKLSLG
jgi:GNAT superfamily N-acetyltransferase